MYFIIDQAMIIDQYTNAHIWCNVPLKDVTKS